MLNPYTVVALAAVAYILAADGNVAPFLVLQTKRLGLHAQRALWIARYHPATPWAKREMNRRAWRLSEELKKSFNSSSGESEVG